MTILSAALAFTLALSFTPMWGDNPPKWATDLAAGRADSALYVASLDSLYHFQPEWTIGAAEPVGRVVEFTLPTMQARGCGAGPDSLHDALQWRVAVRRQSPAWLAMRPAMEANPTVWAAIWPIVRAEAEPVVVAQGLGLPGAPVSTTVADTVAAPKWYSVTASNGRGTSCVSNIIEGK